MMFYPVDHSLYPDGYKTKWEHPYDYDPIVQYMNKPKDPERVYTLWSDRMIGWDYNKFNRCAVEAFGDESQYFDHRSPKDIKKFLELYIGTEIHLSRIEEQCNVSNGFPVWVFQVENIGVVKHR